MTIGSSGKGPNRAIMQHLSLTDWKLASRLQFWFGDVGCQGWHSDKRTARQIVVREYSFGTASSDRDCCSASAPTGSLLRTFYKLHGKSWLHVSLGTGSVHLPRYPRISGDIIVH